MSGDNGDSYGGSLGFMHVEPWEGPQDRCYKCGKSARPELARVNPQLAALVFEDGLCDDCGWGA